MPKNYQMRPPRTFGKLWAGAGALARPVVVGWWAVAGGFGDPDFAGVPASATSATVVAAVALAVTAAVAVGGGGGVVVSSVALVDATTAGAEAVAGAEAEAIVFGSPLAACAVFARARMKSAAHIAMTATASSAAITAGPR
jgi:hypothetical protein